MDYNSFENRNRNGNINRSNALEVAALVLGIISISTCTCLYTGMICGALAAMFASLSRGNQEKMSPRAQVGFWLGITGLGLTVILYIIAYLFTISQYGSIEGLLRAYSEMYGIDYDSIYGDYF